MIYLSCLIFAKLPRATLGRLWHLHSKRVLYRSKIGKFYDLQRPVYWRCLFFPRVGRGRFRKGAEIPEGSKRIIILCRPDTVVGVLR